MRKSDKLKNIELANKTLLGENKQINNQQSFINEGYTFNDADEESAKQLAGIISKEMSSELTNMIKKLSENPQVKEMGVGSAEVGLAMGLATQKIVMG